MFIGFHYFSFQMLTIYGLLVLFEQVFKKKKTQAIQILKRKLNLENVMDKCLLAVLWKKDFQKYTRSFMENVFQKLIMEKGFWRFMEEMF